MANLGRVDDDVAADSYSTLSAVRRGSFSRILAALRDKEGRTALKWPRWDRVVKPEVLFYSTARG
jgi:hypothetical protein